MSKTNGDCARDICIELMDMANIIGVQKMFEYELQFLSDMCETCERKNDNKMLQFYQDRIDKCVEGLHKINNIQYS